MTVSDTTRTGFPFLASLEGRPDAESRRVLLRVATDRFVNDPAPSRAAIAEFEKAALALLSDRDPVTRLVVARKIAPRIDAPPSVLAAIFERGHDAALLILECAVAAPRALLFAAASGEAIGASAVAKRTDLDDEMVAVLAQRPIVKIALTLANNLAAPIGPDCLAHLVRRARDDRALAEALLARPASPLDQASLFMFASLEQRKAILIAAQRAELGRPAAPATWRAPDDAVRRLETYALSRQPDLLIEALAEALDCEVELARRIVDEPSGEPLAVALAALAASQEASMRILLLGHSPLNLDTNRLGALTRLKDGLRPAAARRVISAMTEAPQRRRTTAKPVLDPAAAPVPSRTTPAPAARASAEAAHIFARRRRTQIVVAGRIVRES
jgi:uncharacterized protein (DUF2336 family)